jgi:hypothetical protein
MGVVIETCIKYPVGPTRIRVTDIPYIQHMNTVKKSYGTILVLYYTGSP